MPERESVIDFLSNLQIRVFTWRFGVPVGTDRFGNRYFRDRRHSAGRRDRRWVLYNGASDASKVPPEWHGWLHHSSAAPMKEGDGPFHKPWQQPYVPNQSGTLEAYRPPGHTFEGGHRAAASGDYEPWTPN
ncbi:MAG: NADH:ubiquinone oxidoreductase subunit NDUFA12 [Azospirillaceae bacterium]|nr:NADH:ubiquinone oxidoreductase subunit NDUFA12 [Azospirillaceae bacterium]